MERWQYTVLFWVVVIGVFIVLFSEQIGIELDTLKLSALGSVTVYVLSADRDWAPWKKKPPPPKEDKPPPPTSHRKDADDQS